jgi:hypothetical protein
MALMPILIVLIGLAWKLKTPAQPENRTAVVVQTTVPPEVMASSPPKR